MDRLPLCCMHGPRSMILKLRVPVNLFGFVSILLLEARSSKCAYDSVASCHSRVSRAKG